MFIKNDVKKYKYLATLDGRTSDICRALDGQVFEVGKGPVPPMHINCRSQRVPYEEDEIKTKRPAVSDTRTRKQREKDFRKESRETGESVKGIRERWKKKNITTVDSDLTYGQWLKGETVAFQKEVLGKTQADLFRKGGLTLDRFVDPTGKRYTIDELYTLNRDAFRKAGLPKPR